MKLGVLGAGYVGLVTAAGFAKRGHTVTCVDIDESKIRSLAEGIVPWYEPGLSDIVSRAVDAGNLRFTSDASDATDHADIVFIAVGTPPAEDGSADTSAVFAAARDIGDSLTAPVTVAIRSTVPVGTARTVRSLIAERTGIVTPVLSNPEFLREGNAVADFDDPTRVVIGSEDPDEASLLMKLYSDVVQEELIVLVDTQSAEMSKYASNAFLAAKISFMNEMAGVCESVGADIEHVRRVMGFDPRIGSAHLAPGIGFGGSCLTKDIQAVIHMGRSAGADVSIVEQVYRVNAAQPARLVRRLEKALGGSLSGKTIAVWGLAFKAETDDVRDAPSLRLISDLTASGAHIRVYDPKAMPQARSVLPSSVEFTESMYHCATDADSVVIVTEWDEFKNPDWNKVKSVMVRPIVFDGRNLHDPDRMGAEGFAYYSIGRTPEKPQSKNDPDYVLSKK